MDLSACQPLDEGALARAHPPTRLLAVACRQAWKELKERLSKGWTPRYDTKVGMLRGDVSEDHDVLLWRWDGRRLLGRAEDALLAQCGTQAEADSYVTALVLERAALARAGRFGCA